MKEQSMVTVCKPVGLGRDTAKRQESRAALAGVLWTKDGSRRLPGERELVEAMEACDARDVWWVCEASSAGPVYLLPTKPWITQLCKWLDSVGARTVLEVAAGDGFLSRCIRDARPGLTVMATDDGSWSKPAARMSAEDKERYTSVPFAGIRMDQEVQRLTATAAIKRFKPDVVLVAWPPPGNLVERIITAPSRLVLDISVEGDVCGDVQRTWRFNKEFMEGPLQDKALCRLDSRPTKERATRVTLYYGAAHPEHGVDDGDGCIWAG